MRLFLKQIFGKREDAGGGPKRQHDVESEIEFGNLRSQACTDMKYHEYYQGYKGCGHDYKTDDLRDSAFHN